MSNFNEAQIKKDYELMNVSQLEAEYNRVISIPNARTNIEALTRMTALMGIFEERGIPMPGRSAAGAGQSRHGGGSMPRPVDAVASGSRQRNQSQQRRYAEPESSFNVGSFLLGLVILGVGVALTAGGGGIFYGAIIVGLVMIVKSFF